jgi:hypothetical protein
LHILSYILGLLNLFFYSKNALPVTLIHRLPLIYLNYTLPKIPAKN